MKNFIVRKCRVLAIVFLCCIVHIGAYAQTADKKISYKCDNEKMSVVFEKLERLSGYYKFQFAFSDVESFRVTTDLKDVTVPDAVKAVIAGHDLVCSTDNEFIYVTQSKSELTKGRNIIRGKVTDKAGEPLPGAHVALQGTRMVTVTNADGEYSLSIPKNGTLLFSFMGMESKRIQTSNKNVVNVTLEETDSNLDEVVVTGLVTHDAKSFTGNAAVFSGENLKDVGHQNLLKSLALLDPSISIAENTEMGGDPNTMPKIRLRGESSFQGFENVDKSGLMSDPNMSLFILDGYETSVERIIDLDMNRVESITILKDAAAGAIYGARAANGVIVVKTVQPKAGKLQVSYSADLDFNLPDLSSYDLLNASENLDLINRLGLYRNTDGTLMNEYNQIATWVAEGVNTDWLSQPLRNSVGQKHSLNLGGGDSRMRYGLDLNYNNNPGVMKGSSRDTYGIGVNLSYNANDKVLFSNYLSIYQTNSKESPYGNFSDYTSINSFYPIYDEYGKLNKYYYHENEYGSQTNIWGNSNNLPINPLYEATVGNKNESTNTNINENFSFDWRILPEFRINGRLSYTKSSGKNIAFLSPNSTTYSEYGVGMSDLTIDDELTRGKYTFIQNDKSALEGNIMGTYAKDFGSHFFTASAGGSLSDAKSVNYGFVAQGFGSEDMPEPSYAAGYEEGGTPTSTEGHSRLASFFSSANYAYDSRYLVDASFRLDGSSAFGSKKKSAPFYSFGLGWNAHNESFIKKLGFVNLLKFHVTYGELGSVNFAPYQAKDIYQLTTTQRYDGNLGVILKGLGNENLRWQNTKSMDYGVNLGIFNRFDFSLSIYNKETKHMVLPVTTPPSVGFDSYTENLGSMSNKGYDFSVRAFVVKTRNFNVSLFANGSHNKNKILAISTALDSFNKQSDTTDAQLSHTFLTRYEEGQSSTAIYAVRSLGIDPQTGDEIFLTKDDKLTTTWNSADKVVVGDTEATLRGTFGSNVRYKNLYVNLTFAYQFGGQAYNQTLVDKVENSNKYKNVDKRVLTETWQKPGDVVSYKANVTSRYAQYYTYASSRFVQDNNYLQLASLSVQYELPKKWINPVGMESLRLSLNTSDLYYTSTIKRERGTAYPYTRSFTVGLRANF